MSEKKIIVSNVAKEYSNPIAELVQVACQFDSEIRLESDEARINAKLPSSPLLPFSLPLRPLVWLKLLLPELLSSLSFPY